MPLGEKGKVGKEGKKGVESEGRSGTRADDDTSRCRCVHRRDTDGCGCAGENADEKRREDGPGAGESENQALHWPRSRGEGAWEAEGGRRPRRRQGRR